MYPTIKKDNNSSKSEPNEFEEFLLCQQNEFLNDVDNAKFELLDFLNNQETGEYATPIDFEISFDGDGCFIEHDTELVSSQHEQYCVKVIEEALKDAYATENIKPLAWDTETHKGILHLEALF